MSGRRILLLAAAAAFISLAIALGDTAMINSVNTGEVSGELAGRQDLQKYYSAVRLMENLYCQPQGGAGKRPGTYYISATADSDNVSRLIEFAREPADAVIMEFGHETIRFYK